MRMLVVVTLLVLSVNPALAEPSGGASEAAATATWYAPKWLLNAPHAPVFEVRDTLHKYGRYADKTKAITLKDLIKFHGHLCGGLVEAAVALKAAFEVIFPDGVVDRTDLRVVSSNSACGGDTAAYLTGARTRFGAHYIDTSFKGGDFIVQQVSTGKTVRVRRNPAIYPAEVKAQMKKIQSGKFTSEDIDRFGTLQWGYARRLVQKPPAESFIVKEVSDYQWPQPPCQDLGRRTDNDYKAVPAK